MSYLIPTLMCDFYKISHREQYPENTEVVYSTWTARSGKHSNGIQNVTAFGFQGFIKEYLIEFFDKNFFQRSKADVVHEYSRYLKHCLFRADPYTKHIEDLHDLGYLPLKIKAVKEGSRVPFRVPMLTIENTDKRFFWLTNYFETLASNSLWKPATTASIARQYRQTLETYAWATTKSLDGVDIQAHDFSMRGMSGIEDASRSGVGHLLYFIGTDSATSIQYAEKFYNANIEKEIVGISVNATEHSVMCAGGKNKEFETYRRLVQDIYPTGIISIVSDTWDLWHVLTDTLPKLKDIIMARDGGPDSIDKVVIRPDSGDPADIVCGDPKAPIGSPAYKGVVELLYETFGGTVSSEGCKILDSHIGAIYGDAITLDRCVDICERLRDKGFASTNLIYGIGSFTYQYITRDTLGFAMKSTAVTIDGEEIAIFKDPITDDGIKKSAFGRVAVVKKDDELMLIDNLKSDDVVPGNLLRTIYENGVLVKEVSLAQIREKVKI